MRSWFPLLLPLLSLGLAGCIDVQTTVRVSNDGSGFVEERMLMSETMTQMMVSMGGTSDGAAANEEKLREQARSMGEGVELREVKPLSDGKREGYVALFSFKDINQLKLDQNPGDKAPNPPGVKSDAGPEGQEYITFTMIPGPTASLLVKLPDKAPGSKSSSPPPTPAGGNETTAATSEDDARLAKQMMEKMFEGLRIGIAVETAGTIVETNATHVLGSKVTLLALDFGALLGDADRFARFSAANPQSVFEAKALMDGLTGIKVELEPEIFIRFTQPVDGSAGASRQDNVPADAGAPR